MTHGASERVNDDADGAAVRVTSLAPAETGALPCRAQRRRPRAASAAHTPSCIVRGRPCARARPPPRATRGLRATSAPRPAIDAGSDGSAISVPAPDSLHDAGHVRQVGCDHRDADHHVLEQLVWGGRRIAQARAENRDHADVRRGRVAHERRRTEPRRRRRPSPAGAFGLDLGFELGLHRPVSDQRETTLRKHRHRADEFGKSAIAVEHSLVDEQVASARQERSP